MCEFVCAVGRVVSNWVQMSHASAIFNVSLVSVAGKCVGVQAYAGLPSEWLEFKMAEHTSWACTLKTMPPLSLLFSLPFLSITVAFHYSLPYSPCFWVSPVPFSLCQRAVLSCYTHLSGIPNSIYYYWEAFRCVEDHSGNGYFMLKLVGLKRWTSEQCSFSVWHVHYS